MVNDNGVPARASGCLVGPANALGELGIGIGEEELCPKLVTDRTRYSNGAVGTHDFVSAHLVGLAPGAHHEGVIESHDGNNVNTLCAELGQVLNISWHVVDGAGRGKST